MPMSYPFRTSQDSEPLLAAGHSLSATGHSGLDSDLFKKYDVNGPRYTSYPTAAQFTEDFGREALLQTLEGEVNTIAPISLYIHIPFCQSPCFYCGCNKIITKNRDLVRKYLDYLHKEMALMRLQMKVYKRPVTQLHWGGGTPTFLDDAEMTELMHHLASYFNLSNQDSRDYSIELDPRTITEERIDLLRGLGFNRVSLGIQDFNPKVQKAINRLQSYEEVAKQVEYIRARAFHSMNFDLIYGLPFQTVDTINETLDAVIGLSPDRISYYNYAHMPARFPAQAAINGDDLPGPEEKLKIFALITEKLQQAGYLHLGMDHFVKQDDSLAKAKEDGTLCRNFQGYSIAKADDIVALGVSSISNLSNTYTQNFRDIDQYAEALDNNYLPIERGVALTNDDLLRKEIIQQITCYRKLDMNAIEQKFNINFAEEFTQSLKTLNNFAADGLVECDNRVIHVTDKGIHFLRNLCMLFDEYLEGPKKAQAQYSRII